MSKILKPFANDKNIRGCSCEPLKLHKKYSEMSTKKMWLQMNANKQGMCCMEAEMVAK